MTTLSKGNYKLASAIRKSILPVASGFVVASPFISIDAYALPQGGQLKAGQVSISQSNKSTVIHQHSNRAVIQWDSFNINSNESVNFHQPSSSSAVLNRIIDQNPSKILGNLSSNGQVFLINPNGIVFGKSARVNVGGIVASSLDITTEDFMVGKYTFTKNLKNKSSKIINKGLINASSSGVILIGSNVMNEGKIYAKLGNVSLVSANKVSVDFDGDGLIQFEIDKKLIEKDKSKKRSVTNTGEIISQGGHVILTAQTSKDVFTHVVNNEGVIKASRIEKRGGDVFLIGGNDSDIVNTGVIDVSATDIAGVNVEEITGNIVLQGDQIKSSGHLIADSFANKSGRISLEANKEVKVSGTVSTIGKSLSSKGGSVKVTAKKVAVEKDTIINASGYNGGGEILIGGDLQGKGNTKTAKETNISKNVEIKADAITSGDGGKVIVWSDKKTSFKGNISAKGGKISGDGGFVEVSGTKKLKFDGTVDTSSGVGDSGMLLLDPEFIKVVEIEGSEIIFDDSIAWDDDSLSFDEALDESITITKSQLEDIKAHIILQATVGIEFEAFVLNLKNDLKLETRNSLALSDEQNSIGKIHGVDISNATINIDNGKLVINSGQNSHGDNDTSTTVKLGKISAENGVDVSSANVISLHDDINTNGSIVLNSHTDSQISSKGNSAGTILNSNVNLTSNTGDITLSGNVDGLNTQELSITAQTGQVSLDEISNVNNLTVQSDSLLLDGNVTVNSNIGFAGVNDTNLKSDVSLQSLSGTIDLSHGVSAQTQSLILESTNDILMGASQLKELNITAGMVQVTGDITTRDDLTINSLSTNVIDSRLLESSLRNIDLSNTSITGDDLSLRAINGDVRIGPATLNSLTVSANNTRLLNDITTQSTLDLTNAATIVLENSLSLESQSASLLLNSKIKGKLYELSLDAENVELGLSSLKELGVTANTLHINDDINTQDDINLNQVSNTDIDLTVKINSINGDILLAQTDLTGDDLSISANNGVISLGLANLNSLKLGANVTRLSNNIETNYALDLNNINTIILDKDLSLTSLQSDLSVNSTIEGQQYNLTLDAKQINLGSGKLKSLSATADTINAFGDIVTTDDIVFNTNNRTNIIANLEFESKSKNIDFSQTHLMGDVLTLKALNGNVNLGQVDLQALTVYAHNANLFNDINTKYLLDLNNSSTVVLNNSLSLKSQLNDLELVTVIQGGNYDLSLNADSINSSDLTSVKSLSVDAQSMRLSGDVSSSDNIDLSNLKQLDLKVDSNISAINFIKLAEQVISDSNQSITLSADSVSIAELGTAGNEIGNVNVNARQLNITKQIKSMGDIDLKMSQNVDIVGNVSLDSSAGIGSIDLSKSEISGNNLIVSAGNNNLLVSKMDLDSLKVIAKNTDVYGDISAYGNLDLLNSDVINVHNNTALSSNIGTLSMNTIVNADNVDLNLNADLIYLGTASNELKVNQLDVSRKGCSTFLNGSINAGSDINFETDSNLMLERDVNIQSKGNLYLSENINGDHSLTLSSGVGSNSGLINLSNTNINNLKINNAGTTLLNGHLQVENSADLSQSISVKLNNNSKISSTYGDINLDSDVQGGNYQLKLNSGNKIRLANTELGSFRVKSKLLEFTGNTISVQNNIDLSQVSQVRFNHDSTIKSVAGNVNLGDVIFSNDSIDLLVQADKVNLNNISNSEHLASSFKVQANSIDLGGNVLSNGILDMSHAEINLKNNLFIKSINGDIDLNQSIIKGASSFLDISSLYGEINLGKVDGINSLSVTTQGGMNLTDSVHTLYDQDYRNTNQITGSKVDLFSQYGNIIFNNIKSDSVDIVAANNINMFGDIHSANNTSNSYVVIESFNNAVKLDDNSKINSLNILIKAKFDISIGHLEANIIELRSTHGSIVIHKSNGVNIKADKVNFSALNNVGSQLSPIQIDVKFLKIESALTAVINGQFKAQDVNTNTQFILPELEFLAFAKDYTLNMNDFTIIDSGLFMKGVNLFSVSDDAVLVNDENEDLYSNNEPVSDDLTIN